MATRSSIREALRATVCYDFRSADCAAGGQGAPLVPYLDVLLFADESEDRVALNLGGIANITLLPAGGRVGAFDTGPANINVDTFVSERTNGGTQRRTTLPMERWPRAGASTKPSLRVVLATMLADAYFALPPPKTTGRAGISACIVPFLRRFDIEQLAGLT